MSRATRDAAAAAEISFVDLTDRGAVAFAQRNADRVTCLDAYVALSFDSIQQYSQLRDLNVSFTPKSEEAEVALFPCSLTNLILSLHSTCINWENFRPLCCLQELQIFSLGCDDKGCDLSGKVQLNDSFAAALPLLRVLYVYAGMRNSHDTVPLETTSKVVMPHLVELNISGVNLVYLDLHFISGLKSLSLAVSTVSTVSAACSALVLDMCDGMNKGIVLVTPNLRSLTVVGYIGQSGGGLHKLDGSKCRHALSIECKDSCIEWVGAKPNVENLRKFSM